MQTALLLRFFGLILLIASVFSCSTELDVNAPYQETKVIYALLDPQQPYQLVRISKAFLNEGRSAYDIAHNSPDSSQYPSGVLEVTLNEYKTINFTQTKTRSWTLYDTVYTTKDTGFFYSPDQVMYKSPNLKLDTNQKQSVVYEITVRNKRTQSLATAKTALCGRITKPELFFKDPLYYDNEPLSVGFSSKTPTTYRVTFPYAAEFMEMNFVWTIQTTRNQGGTEVTTTEEWVWNEPGRYFFRSGAPDGEASVAAGAFINFFKAKEQSIDNTNLVRRKITGLRLDHYFATSEYRKYIAVNGTFNAITQSKPIYSNVQNGLGLVASKNYSWSPAVLDRRNLDTLKLRCPNLRLE